MKSFKVDARALKAVLVTASKNDVRYYLEGILIDNGRMVSTDGHRMTLVESKTKPKGKRINPEIFKVYGQVPKSAVDANFVYVQKNHGVIYFYNRFNCEIGTVLKFEVIEGKFPDYERVIPTEDPTPTDKIGLNIEYVSDIKKIGVALDSKFNAGVFKTYENKTVIEINTPEHHAKCIIMAVKL